MVKTSLYYLAGAVLTFSLVACGGGGGGVAAAGLHATAVVGAPSGQSGAMIQGAALYAPVGMVITPGGSTNGAIFLGSPSLATILYAPDYSDTDFVGSFGVQEGGYGVPASAGSQRGNLPYHAIILNGTDSSSVLDLNPAGCYASMILGVGAGVQVGWAKQAQYFSPTRPFIWFGTPGSARDLTPVGEGGGELTAVSDGIQGGYAFASNNPDLHHAGIWRGTAASFQDMNPQGYTRSCINGMSGNLDVGWAIPSSTSAWEPHAFMWNGGSVVDLNPKGTDSSVALATDGTTEVGYVNTTLSSPAHAALWRGSPESYLDLHAALPPRFYNSQATSVKGSKVYGFAIQNGIYEAVIWNIN